MADLPSIRITPGGERALLRRHPWIFSGAIATAPSGLASGDTVVVCDSQGKKLAIASWSPRSQIRARVWTFDAGTGIDGAFFRGRIERAVAGRGSHGTDPSGACRLIYGESDGLPGLIVDRYRDVLVCQFLAAGVERWKSEIVDQLWAVLSPSSIYERSDVDVRSKEGLSEAAGLVRGEEPPERLKFTEGQVRFVVDIRAGHKTGFYLDQRPNRERVLELARGARVLDVFSYTGGFALAALAGGAAQVVQIESSKWALEETRRQVELNGLDAERLVQNEANAFGDLRRLVKEEQRFDIVVLDPPKFVTSRSKLEAGARGYKDINRLAFHLLRPGGLLFTFSCSGLLEDRLFQKIVADAALDASVEAQITERLGQAADHPTLLSFPEAGYLKGLVCRVLG